MRAGPKGAAQVVLLALLLSASVLPTASAEAPVFQEYQVKAAFLYNFAKFVEWPPDAFASDESPVVIVILGQNPFGDALKSLKGKIVNGRPLVVRIVQSVAEIEPCHILYIAESETGNLAQILKSLESRSILTVGDFEGFARRGGAINMVTESARVVLEVNPEAARRARLAVSSKLMAIARIVKPGKR